MANSSIEMSYSTDKLWLSPWTNSILRQDRGHAVVPTLELFAYDHLHMPFSSYFEYQEMGSCEYLFSYLYGFINIFQDTPLRGDVLLHWENMQTMCPTKCLISLPMVEKCFVYCLPCRKWGYFLQNLNAKDRQQ